MTLWVLFGLMTTLAALAVLWPLARGRGLASAGSDVAVYRDQLMEIERDRAAGSIANPEAEAARVEVSRRLLAAADAERSAPAGLTPGSLWRRRAAAIATLLVLPIGAASLYLAIGSPSLPGEPLAARRAEPKAHQTIAALVTQVEDHLAKNPQDGRGWEVLAPVYARMGRFDDAATAWRNAIALNGETAARRASLGEALTGSANGVVTDEAKRAFTRAVDLDPHEARARYFLGLADEQDGKREEAARTWRALLADAPEDAPWAPFVRTALAAIDPSAAATASAGSTVTPTAAPGPSAADVAAADRVGSGERQEMIRGMVARLAERLKQDGSDGDGWLRLVRSYAVLGEPDKARAAAADARRALHDDTAGLRRINDLVKQLGIEG